MGEEEPWHDTCWELIIVQHMFTASERYWEQHYCLGVTHDIPTVLRDDPKCMEGALVHLLPITPLLVFYENLLLLLVIVVLFKFNISSKYAVEHT